MIVNEDKFRIKSIAKDALGNKKINISFVPPNDDDALGIASLYNSNYSNAYTPSYNTKNSDFFRGIQDCRIISLHPLVKKMLDHIEVEAFPVSSDVTGRSSKINIKIDLDDLREELGEKILNEIDRSFRKSMRLLNFKTTGAKKFRNWYVDGKQAYHIITNDNKEGILELRELDVANLRKIRKEVREKVDGIEVITDYENKYIYTTQTNNSLMDYGNQIDGQNIEIDESAIIYITSGLLNETKTRSVSHLEPLIKPTQTLTMIEDSHVIMRVANASRTRIFYVDIGMHQSTRAEKHIQQIQSKLKFNVEYDTKTGRLRDNRRFVSVLNDIFIPRLSGSNQTTEIKQLPGDENIDKIRDLEYFRSDLIEKSIVPKQRLTANQSFSLGKSNELSREESIFHKQIEGLRQRFADLFHETIKRDLIIRKIMSGDEYDYYKDDIYFIFPTDNHYKMLLQFEILDEKISRIQAIGHDPKLFYPVEVVANTICGFTDEEMALNLGRYKQDIMFVQEIEMDRLELEVSRSKEINPEAFEEPTE